MSSAGDTQFLKASFVSEGTAELIKQIQLIKQKADEISRDLGAINQKTINSLAPFKGAYTDLGNTIATQSEKAATKVETLSTRISTFGGNTARIATAFGTFSASLFGIDQAMDALQKTEFGVEQQRLRTQRATTTLQSLELRLNEARTSGTKTQEEINILEAKHEQQLQRVQVETEKLDFMQQNLNEDYTQFQAQILPQLIAVAGSGITAFTSLADSSDKLRAGLSKITGAINNLGNSSVTTITRLDGALSGMSASSTRAAGGIGVLSNAFRGLFAAMGPVGLAITAIGIVGGALAAHFLSIQNAAGQLVDTVEQIPPVIERFKTASAGAGETLTKSLEDVETKFSGIEETLQRLKLTNENEQLLSFIGQNEKKGLQEIVDMLII